jgi:hypothetical protein
VVLLHLVLEQTQTVVELLEPQTEQAAAVAQDNTVHPLERVVQVVRELLSFQAVA